MGVKRPGHKKYFAFSVTPYGFILDSLDCNAWWICFNSKHKNSTACFKSPWNWQYSVNTTLWTLLCFFRPLSRINQVVFQLKLADLTTFGILNEISLWLHRCFWFYYVLFLKSLQKKGETILSRSGFSSPFWKRCGNMGCLGMADNKNGKWSNSCNFYWMAITQSTSTQMIMLTR